MANGPVQVIIVKKTCGCDKCADAWQQLTSDNETLDFAATIR